ncbi:2-succinyl-5-enolpyruvyl-6-hydroxy-3-cyclohexene-1-carboxylic-acid synthase [Micrococcales bacterium 31B]|nr:2-succinyl-5-enolpyruvyl-6-hydroxy-3-cyclohexene-1-carboxylic-acid synthase [Micrococcales bacterium 31B]
MRSCDTSPAVPDSGSGAVEVAFTLLSHLAAEGLRHVVIAPGSRSGPLVYAAARLERAGLLTCHVRVDERVAAFTALGLAKASVLAGAARPSAVIATSGTAVAHFHAALLEADASDLPLLAITADRPFELLGVGSNQTTRQGGIYGSAVRRCFEIPAATAHAATATELAHAADVGRRASALAVGWGAGLPGPVHVNVAFREPLTPRAGGVFAGAAETEALTLPPPMTHPAMAPLPTLVPRGPRTVVVAGDLSDPAQARAAAALAHEGGYPLLAEPSSLLRTQAAVGDYCSALEAGFSEALPAPERVIVAGHPTLSRPVLRTLLGCGAEIIVQSGRAEWFDVTRSATLVAPWLRLEPGAPSATDVRFLTQWRTACAPPGPAPQPLAAAAVAVWAATRPGDALVMGASSAIRDLERWAPPAPEGAIHVAQRGLAGIDGTVSVAAGLALSGEFSRVRCVLGDITLVHDLNALLVGPRERAVDVDVVVVNDGGGRIFGGLEHAAAEPALVERFFVTPHGADFAALARGFGAEYVSCASPEALAKALAPRPDRGAGLRILEMRG